MASGVDAAQARQGGVQARDARRAAAAGWQHAQAGAARMAGMEVVAWAARSHPQGGRRGAGGTRAVNKLASRTGATIIHRSVSSLSAVLLLVLLPVIGTALALAFALTLATSSRASTVVATRRCVASGGGGLGREPLLRVVALSTEDNFRVGGK